MNDRELLELAAQAAGIDCHVDKLDGVEKLISNAYGAVWNPLCDDGQALRLAVKCSISLNTMLVDGMNRPRHETAACSSYGLPIVRHKHNGDPCAATRRAIVRAAAAIAQQEQTQ
ncbi:hypothetical protein SSTU70S_03689 [Stutzerimonas stutzeri]